MLLENLNSEFICKYFSGEKDNRYADIQSLRPVLQKIDSKPGVFKVSMQNGFANLILDDEFICRRIFDFAQKPISYAQKHFSKVDTTEYRLYVFNVCVKEIWHPICFCAKAPTLCAKTKEIRRLAVMALYLIEKDPQKSESFQKLYDTFSSELYDFLTAGTLKEASYLLKLLTICALKLSVNIPAYQEA